MCEEGVVQFVGKIRSICKTYKITLTGINLTTINGNGNLILKLHLKENFKEIDASV